MAESRRSVPIPTQIELWARAAGRCEFRGCNKLVFRDGLTQQGSNLSVISHIVAYSPGGPRGDAKRSLELRHEISNLMLTCRDHAKVIDDGGRIAEYPESRLLEFKREHEERIERLTGIKPEAQTRIVILQAHINGRSVNIPEAETIQAVQPRYPADEHAFTIDLNVFGPEICAADIAPAVAKSIRHNIDELMRLQSHRSLRLSVFAIAPIPFLVYLGRRLGDTQTVDAFQRHRTTQAWAWPAEETAESFYERTGITDVASAEVAIVLSISGAVSISAVRAAVPDGVGIVELRSRRRSLDFMRSRARLEAFAMEVRDIMTELHERGVSRLHVFAAVPAPAAIEFGRAARKLNGEIIVYEYDEGRNEYGSPLTL